MRVNSRVQVKIADPSEWNPDAFETLNGCFGYIEEVMLDHGAQCIYYLVRLETPVEKWALRSESQEDNQITHWHFDEKNLIHVE